MAIFHEGLTLVDRIEISLYYDDHVYETEDEYAFIEDNKICFYEATSEKAPGERYAFKHQMDEENTRKLFDSLRADYGEPPESIERAFSGKNSMNRVKEYCQAHDILF